MMVEKLLRHDQRISLLTAIGFFSLTVFGYAVATLW